VIREVEDENEWERGREKIFEKVGENIRKG